MEWADRCVRPAERGRPVFIALRRPADDRAPPLRV